MVASGQRFEVRYFPLTEKDMAKRRTEGGENQLEMLGYVFLTLLSALLVFRALEGFLC